MPSAVLIPAGSLVGSYSAAMQSQVVDRAALSRVLTVHNGKGGVLKTSLATNLAGILARAKYNILLIDLDAQGNCADDLGCADQSDDGAELAAAMAAGRPLRPVLWPRERLAFVPGGRALDRFAEHLDTGRRAEDLLTAPLAAVAADYDLTIIDTPPASSSMTRAALGAARWLIVPTAADISSLKGLLRVAETMAETWQANPDLEMLGAVITKVGARSSSIKARVRDQLTTALGAAAPVFDQTVRYAERAAEADRRRGQLPAELAELDAGPGVWTYLAAGQAVPDEARDRTADKQASQQLASDYVRLAQELLSRLSAAEARADDPADTEPATTTGGAR